MNENIYYFACTVFEGKIVVSRGYSKLVEAYDYYENKWSYFPDVIEERHDHASVSMSNKLFVIGGYDNTNCEVFDSFSRKFTLIKADVLNSRSPLFYKAVCIGNSILVIIENYDSSRKDKTISNMCIYDVEKNHWSKKNCSFLKSLNNMAFVKYCTD